MGEPVAQGRTVEIFGLVNGTEFNGSVGMVEEYMEAKQRWKIKFASGVEKNFKSDNLRVIKTKKVKKKKDKDKDREKVEAAPEEAPEEAPLPSSEKPSEEGTSKAERRQAQGQRNNNVAGSLADTLSLLGFASTASSEQQAEEVPDSSSPPKAQAAPPTSQVAAEAQVEEETAEKAGDVPLDVAEEAKAPAEEAKAPQEAKAPAEEAKAPAEEAKVPAEEAKAPADVEKPKASSVDSAQLVVVNVAGRRFEGNKALVEHVRAIQARLDGSGEEGSGTLAGEDLFLVFHILMRNLRTVEKFREPVRGIRYGRHANFPNSCFIVLFEDGSEEPVSLMRCIKELFNPNEPSKKPQKRKRPVETEMEAADS